MGDEKKCEKKGGCSVMKFFAALILVAALVVGGSYVADKAFGHPELNLVTKIMNAVNSHTPK
jgi:hypothetical protein